MERVGRIELSKLRIGLLLVFVFATCAYSFSEKLSLTHEYPGYKDGSWRFLSVYTFGFLNYWFSEGAFSSYLSMSFHPADFYNENQYFYYSYSPVFLFPLHLVAWLRGFPLSLDEIMLASLFLQMITALLIAILILKASGEMSISGWRGFFLAVCAVLFFFISSASSIVYPNAWWPDNVGYAVFLLVLLYEFSREKVYSAYLEVPILALLSLTDWLLFPLLGALWLKRHWSGERNAFSLILSAILSALLFSLSLFSRGGGRDLLEKISVRMSLVPVPQYEAVNVVGWVDIFSNTFGAPWLVFYFIGAGALPVLAFFFWKKPKELGRYHKFAFCYLAAIYTHNFLLWQHYAIHSYNTLKFILIFPLLAGFFLHSRKLSYSVFGAMILLIGLGEAFWAGERQIGGRVTLSEQQLQLCAQLKKHVRKEDAFFVIGNEGWLGGHLQELLCDFRFFHIESQHVLLDRVLRLAGLNLHQTLRYWVLSEKEIPLRVNKEMELTLTDSPLGAKLYLVKIR